MVEAAAARSLAAVAITDHDVTDGLAEAAQAGRALGVEVVPGIELTASWNGRTVHVLGYFVDPTNPALRHGLVRARELMAEHVDGVLRELADLGQPLERQSIEKYRSRYPGGAGLIFAMLENGTLRREPRARATLRRASREPRAFDAPEAIGLIHTAGGLASLAHPGKIFKGRPDLEKDEIRPLVEAGLDGLEAWQIVHSPETREHYRRIADSLGVLATGGSDCHGAVRAGRMRLGSQQVPEEVLAALRQARKH